MLKVQEIREIIKLIDQSSITEFNYESNGTSVSLKKGSNGAAVGSETPQVTETAAVQIQRQSEPVQEQVVEKQAEVIEEQQEVKVENNEYDFEIVSPMVGTFYGAPSPEDDAYVAVGSIVQSNSIVCIVEAMKLFNEIEAEVSGEIVEILVENGELVEYGQPLFRVKKK
ncbi:acetyl-CoA carboxylase biotin carboxyl carrier protein [Oceanobacillus alkalisoli]|uniref:acetyl-CoA carboxylase biotin carboxyl carrier protein n=1 Tax=Oceanobacillus alkalisoli TaxID=2925113 RepID=UPI001EF154BD|nr:acetyl-CoA carboxylase biotin carboxyl carrier protein [Oceanobacillus alkalisoli]MCF3941733.1 acetyl-CoA carboxylase biotin carboxyl carrier protein [Oceanobacillus alkalisoli]MCG5103014.1 acetyl-CoA carboxylase biotin carboxyl carrier protein [Oceanobacillus alkalisoli]